MSDYKETVTLESGESFEIYIKKPTNSMLNKAERHKAKVWNEAFKEGVMTKKEVQQIMEDRGIWNEEKAEEERVLTAEILALEKKLYRGDGESKPKLSDGRKLAVQMRNKRLQLRDLIADRISMDENTVEALADNAKFDYLVATCSFYTDGDRPIFANYEDYNKRSSDEVSVAAAQLLAKMIYQLDKDFENNLPENRFLKQFNLINDEGMLVDPNDQDVFVDVNGRRISSNGHYLDEDGNRVDVNGEPLDDAGFYAITEYEDDLSEEKKAPAKKTTRKRRTTKKQQTSTTE
tara:strand:- start:1650 stop:2522 length:873 start_codon:yes stop_codon:yes gene_type:complete